MTSKALLITLIVCVGYRFVSAGGYGLDNAVDYGNGGYSGGGYPAGGYPGGYPAGGYSTGGGYPAGGYQAGGYPAGGYPDNTDQGYNAFGGSYGVPSQSVQNNRYSMYDNRISNAGGNAAGAGQASAYEGTAQSINQANHQASRGMTSSSGLSANSAQGLGVQASGAAQAGGSVEDQRQRGLMSENNSGYQQYVPYGRRR